jgi:small-conductance mechanosensitive channel
MTTSLADLATWIPATVAVLGGLGVGLVVRRFVVPLLAHAAGKSAWKYDDALIEAIRGPVVLWFLLIGLRTAVRLLPLESQLDRTLGLVVLVVGILSVTWAVARFAGLVVSTATAGALPGVSLIANVVRVLVLSVGLLIVLQTLGIAITPIITALGVGGLAVGLALQDTLTNFFAGLRLLAAGRIRPGDYVRLDSGEEGFVLDITWAQTTIRQLPNSQVIVPNAKLVGAIVTNYNLPDAEQAVVLQVSVAYGSDLEKVERVTTEVARAVQQEVAGAVPAFEPFIRYHTFADSGIGFSVILRATHHTDRFVPIHEFVKRLHARYAAEGIEIPFPVRTVHLKQS